MAKQRTGFSDFLHQRKFVLGMRWKTILSNAYLSRATLHRIRHGDPHHPIAEVDSLRSLSHALKFDSWPELVAAYDRNDPKSGIDQIRLQEHPPRNGAARLTREPPVQEDAVVTLSKALNLTPTELVKRLGVGVISQPSRPVGIGTPFPSSLRTSQLRPARMVPHFVSGVAASKLVEKLEDEDHESKQPVGTEDFRVFTVPVDGDCQSPVWNDGEVVVFSFDAFDREGILPGKSYYLAFTDGSTTFKRVFLDSDNPDIYILRCWNTSKYPGERRVRHDEVVRVARAMCKQLTPQE